jgi:hypothetical protein
VEQVYHNWLKAQTERNSIVRISTKDFPINTHGGLLAFGAPWEVPKPSTPNPAPYNF